MPSPSHPAATFAAAASAAAGIIHATAAGSHADLTTLSRLFALAAVAQVGWAAAVLARPSKAMVLAGIGVNLAVLNAWVVTRATGISAIEGLETAQPVGTQDAVAASFAVLAAVGAALALGSDPVPRAARALAPVAAVAVLLGAVPAMASGPHDHASHGDDHADAEVAGVHTHNGEHAEGDDHGHDEQHEVPEPAVDLGYPAGFASFLDEAPSPEARDRAESLILGTMEAMKAFPDEASLQAAGFLSIGDGATGYEHYINVGRIADPAVLDPNGIESVVLKVSKDGTKEVASAMYLLPFGKTMADVPDIAEGLTEWHDHQNLCWEGARVVGTTDATGSCTRGQFRGTQPMLHVWVTDHPCGPFAGIEGSHGTGCAHAHED